MAIELHWLNTVLILWTLHFFPWQPRFKPWFFVNQVAVCSSSPKKRANRRSRWSPEPWKSWFVLGKISPQNSRTIQVSVKYDNLARYGVEWALEQCSTLLVVDDLFEGYTRLHHSVHLGTITIHYDPFWA